MQTWIALFRAINVGGKNILPMAKLKISLESLECKNIRTYIQSGNVVFNTINKSASLLSKKIAARIKVQHGFEPHVLLLSSEELLTAIEMNPFPEAALDPKTLHFFFLDKPPTMANIESLDNAKTSTEKYSLIDRVFYLHTPDGVGRSKLAANVETYLGVVTTARNYRTVEKLASMIAQT